jgi:hypothetical protein
MGSSAIASAIGAGAMLADGGTAHAAKPVIVGERGPELFVPGTTGVVIPNEVMEAARENGIDDAIDILRDGQETDAASRH